MEDESLQESNAGNLWDNEELILLSRRSKTFSLTGLSTLHRRTPVAILFQLLKRGKLTMVHGNGSNIPKKSLVGFRVASNGIQYRVIDRPWSAAQEQQLQDTLDQEPSFARLVKDTRRKPMEVISKLLDRHTLVLNDGHDLGVGDEFFAVMFLLPPQTYKPWVDGPTEMLKIVEVIIDGSVTYIARKHTPTQEQRERLDKEAECGFIDPWGEVCNEDLLLEQRQDHLAYLKDNHERYGV
jgi:hypothetical protein